MEKPAFVFCALVFIVLFAHLTRRESPPALARGGTPPIHRPDVPGRRVLLALNPNESATNIFHRIYTDGGSCLRVRTECELAPDENDVRRTASAERLLLAPACSYVHGRTEEREYVLEWHVTLRRSDGSHYVRFVHEPVGYRTREYATWPRCDPGGPPE